MQLTDLVQSCFEAAPMLHACSAASPALPGIGSKSVRPPNESLLGLKTLVVGMRNDAIVTSDESLLGLKTLVVVMRNDAIVTSATPRSLIASFSPLPLGLFKPHRDSLQ